MRSALPAAAAFGLILSSGVSASQPQGARAPETATPKTSPDDNAIVVTGRRLPDKEVNRFIYDMLRPLSVGQDDQYPRLSDPFCPSVIGFTPTAKTVIETRMRTVAKAAGVELGDPGDCKPNVHLMRVEDGPAMIRELRKTAPRAAFGEMSRPQRASLEAGEGPVYTWQQTLRYGADSGQVISGNAADLGPGDPSALNFNFIYENPRLRLGANTAFRHATVLVERAALDDVSAIQLADFAVMRGLVPAREDRHRKGARTQDTILNLFDRAADPDERLPSLGRTDLALLTALYAAPDNVNANRQRGRMVATFRKVLDELD
ncbi:MAG: hypothetical protein AAF291_11635 [Pseudomonadota bacterium]